MFGRPPTGSAANRPGSRASWGRGANQFINTAAGPPKTSTAMPHSSGISVPPSTAKMRPGTSTRGAMLPIHERPMTQQGIGGPPKTGVQGTSGRMVQDSSFWIGEIKQRLTLLAAETNKVRNDIDQFEKENASFVSLEKRAQMAAQELRDIQGQLGDYNTLIDKLHTDADLEDIQLKAKELNVKNTREQQAVDNLFMERRGKEQTIKDRETNLKAEKENIFRCISQLGGDAKTQWTQLEAEQTRLQKILLEQQQLLAALLEKKERFGKLLYQDPLRQKAWNIVDQKAQLEKQLQELQQLERNEAMDTKESLLQSIKDTNGEIQVLDKQAGELEKTQAALKQELEYLEDETKDEKLAKYEELLKKDQEMTQFLAQFKDTYAGAIARQEQLQQSIVQMLTEIHRLATAVIGTPSEMKQVNETVKEKEKELKQTELTVDTMELEKERLKSDLEKIKGLEAKIELEMQNLAQKQVQMDQDMQKFAQAEDIKAELTASKSEWESTLKALESQHAQAEVQLKELNMKYEIKSSQLNENETHRALQSLVIKWKNLHANASALQQSIQEIVESSDYQEKKEETMALADMCLAQNIKLVGLSV